MRGPAEREQCRPVIRQATRQVPAGCCRPPRSTGNDCVGRSPPAAECSWLPGPDHGSGTVLGQRQVADKHGVNTALQPLLSGLDTTGMVITLDALQTTKKTARLIAGPLRAHYILILKAKSAARPAGRASVAVRHRTPRSPSTPTAVMAAPTTTRRRLPTTHFPGARQVFRLGHDTGGLDGVRTSKRIVEDIANLTRRSGRPSPPQPLHPPALDRGEPAPGQGRDVPRRLITAQNR